MLRRRRRGFTTRWTVAGDATARTITLPLNSGNGSTFNCMVDWGDGTSSTVISATDANRVHTYAVDGTYDVEIRGTCEGWSFSNGGSKLKFTKVLFLGDRPTFSGFKYLEGGFQGAIYNTSAGYGQIFPSGNGPTNLIYLYADNPITTIPDGNVRYMFNVTNMEGAYLGNRATSVPAYSLASLVLVTNLSYVYATGNNLQLNADIFYRDGEQATRFLGKTMKFTGCFTRSGAFTGAQGVAPDLWNCDFGETITLDVAPSVDWGGGDTITGQASGATAVVVAKVSALVYKIKKHFGTFTLGEVVGVTDVADKLADQGAANPTFSGTPVSAGCFSGHDISTVSNYADIPASWK